MLLGQRLSAMPAVLCCWLVTMAMPSCAWGLTLEAKAQGLAHYMMAVCYDLNDQTPEAIAEYKKSVKANGLEPAPRLKLGAYYLRLDQVDQATSPVKSSDTYFPPGIAGPLFARSHLFFRTQI